MSIVEPPDDLFRGHHVVPVVVIDDPDDAPALGNALVDGGILCAEITFRTAAAGAAIKRLSQRDDLLVGAGTVLDAAQVDLAVDLGARFIVSPGFSTEVVRRAAERGVPAIPGVATASEVQGALSSGVRTVKLFPAGLLGGVDMVRALAGPFPELRFIPSGGITLADAPGYLALPCVTAVGGSWMVPRDAILAHDFARVSRLCAETVAALQGPT